MNELMAEATAARNGNGKVAEATTVG